MKNRLYISVIFVFLSFISFLNHSQAREIPRVSMGLGGSFGYYGIYSEYKSGQDYDMGSGTGYGFGFVFERMVSGSFGIHSGLWYSTFKTSFKGNFEDDKGPFAIDGDVETTMITLPVYLLTSFKSGRFSFNVLSGLQFSYIKSNELVALGTSSQGTSDFNYDMISETSYAQIGLGGGIEFKFGISKFIDIFIITIGEWYLIPILDGFGPNESGSEDYLYDVKVQSGVLFRTF